MKKLRKIASLQGLAAHWRGHVLLFDKPHVPPTYEPAAGRRLLLIVAALEGLRVALTPLQPRLPPLWLQVPIYLGLALLSVRVVAGLAFSEIGFRRWREWNPTEKSYFIQIMVIANVVFPMVFASRLRTILAEPGVITTIWTVFVPYLVYGFYQEVLYRGMLQTELVRRWGALRRIAVSNSLYTFGPLHYYYFFSAAASLAVPMFAAIFAIGLLFAIIFRRSGNLWIVAVMHGIGNSYIVGSLGTVR